MEILVIFPEGQLSRRRLPTTVQLPGHPVEKVEIVESDGGGAKITSLDGKINEALLAPAFPRHGFDLGEGKIGRRILTIELLTSRS